MAYSMEQGSRWPHVAESKPKRPPSCATVPEFWLMTFVEVDELG